MDEDNAFLLAVQAAPDDAHVRLVYADWLDERGDPRAEFPRCQVARDRLPPADPACAPLLEREARLRQAHPAVIRPWERQLTLARIRALIAGGGANPYTPAPCLTEPEAAAWEAAHGVALPEEYRLFLRGIGDGGVMPGAYCDFDLRPLTGVGTRPARRTRSRLRPAGSVTGCGRSGWRAGRRTGCCSPNSVRFGLPPTGYRGA